MKEDATLDEALNVAKSLHNFSDEDIVALRHFLDTGECELQNVQLIMEWLYDTALMAMTECNELRERLAVHAMPKDQH